MSVFHSLYFRLSPRSVNASYREKTLKLVIDRIPLLIFSIISQTPPVEKTLKRSNDCYPLLSFSVISPFFGAAGSTEKRQVQYYLYRTTMLQIGRNLTATASQNKQEF